LKKKIEGEEEDRGCEEELKKKIEGVEEELKKKRLWS